jgi:hypothetical protein
MRIFEAIQATDAILPPGYNELTVNGPTYQLTAQSQIWRLLFAHSLLEITAQDPTVGPIYVADAFLRVVLNPNKGADRHIKCPSRVTLFGPYGQGLSAYDSVNGTFQSFGYDTRNVDVRGDDIPNYGGVQLVPPGQPTVFSLQLQFVWAVISETAVGNYTLTPYFDVSADLSDMAAVSNLPT